MWQEVVKMRGNFGQRLLVTAGSSSGGGGRDRGLAPQLLSVVRVFCAGLALLGSVAVSDAARFIDVNCNGIGRDIETDRNNPGVDCIDYFANGNSCVKTA